MNVETIPLELRERPQWVVWRTEERAGRMTKIPYRTGGARASTTDPATWATFEDALLTAEAGEAEGVGFVFSASDPYVGVDLDELNGDAGAIMSALSSYTERSVSGRGAHVILRGSLNGTPRRRKGPVEIYADGRYFVMTGEHVQGTPATIEDRQAELEEVLEHVFGAAQATNGATPPAPVAPLALDDEELLERARRARNGADFERLWAGDTTGYDSHSEADLALCGLLAFWCGPDVGRVDRLFRRSGLMRAKWDERRGETTYGAETIARALEGRTEFYSWPKVATTAAPEPVNGGDDRGQAAFSIRVYTATELAALELPTPAEPITEYVRRAMATLIGGLTGHGKSTWIAWQVKAAAEAGAHVLVLDLEQHLQSIQRLIAETGLELCTGVDFAPIPEGLALNSEKDGRAARQLEALEAVFAAGAHDLLVVDPFYKLHEADSSDELQARLLVALLRRWISEYGFALLMATHCRKLPPGRTTITLDDLFGSSLFTRDPEIVLGIQRHGTLTKLHVFKSREPGLDLGHSELLFSRERGYWPKPTVDPEEREAELEQLGQAAVAHIAEDPGCSTRALARALKIGQDRAKIVLERQVQSGLLPEPLQGRRGAHAWYPLNHAALTAPETLLGAVSADAEKANPEASAPDRPDRYVSREGRQGSALAEADPALEPTS